MIASAVDCLCGPELPIWKRCLSLLCTQTLTQLMVSPGQCNARFLQHHPQQQGPPVEDPVPEDVDMEVGVPSDFFGLGQPVIGLND